MKRIIATLLCCVMLAGSLSFAAFAQTFTYEQSFTVADANGDTRINAVDALTMRRYIANGGQADIVFDAADINNDGRVNASDVLLLRKILAQSKDVNDYQSEKNVDKFTIAKNDIKLYTIVLPAGTTEAENIYYAATELQRYVRIATGFTLPITYGESDASHKINFALVESGSEMASKLEIENYIYEVVDGQLNIYGTRRGNMYAVYEILENYIGYRFFDDDETLLYQTRWVDIEEGTYKFYKPALSFRFAGQGFSQGEARYHYFPRKINGTQIYAYYEAQMGTLTGPQFINAHSYGYYYRMATGPKNAVNYQKKYEGGIQQDETKWNPCSTDDETYEILFRGLLETMDMVQSWGRVFHAETTSMSFSICDNPNFCPCWYCKQISNESGVAGLNLYLANRAAVDIKECYDGRPASVEDDYGKAMTAEYPDMKIYTIIYRHELPNKILPEENVIIMFCGTACNNHFFETDECKGHLNNLGGDSYADVQSLKAWGQVCKEQGAQLWFWYYPVNYNTYLTDSPNIFNIYYDFKYLVDNCNVTGIFYEGGGRTYGFELLKSHLASMMMWEPDMSYDRFVEILKEYLYMYYGEGYEDIYEYILMHNAAGDASPCYINNCDRPGDMFDYDYIHDNYEEMRALLVSALDKTEDSTKRTRVEMLLVSCDFLGLSASYDDYHVNGTDTQRQTYADRYTWMHNYIKDHNMDIFAGNAYKLPELDLDTKPIISYYEFGSYNKKNEYTWGYSPAPKWGYS